MKQTIILMCIFNIILLNSLVTKKNFIPIKFDQIDLDSIADNDLFKKYITHHEKKYIHDSKEGQLKFKQFKINLEIIKKANKINKSYKLALNHLSDLTHEEYVKKLGLKHDVAAILALEKKIGYIKPTILNLSNRMKIQQTQYEQKDWSSYFLDVRSQDTCGSCWAFSSTGVLEAHIAINGGIKQYLSPQHLLNCDTDDQGCEGGNFPNTFNWIQANGLVSDSVLPYKNVKEATCDSSLSGQVVGKMANFDFCSISGEKKCTEDIVYGFLSSGPVNVGIDAGSADFQNYSSGVFTLATCSASNHAVILAGYGIDANSQQQYWLVRNSWGNAWGENGFIRVLRNEENKNSCFIVQEAFVPKLV